jgi:NTE family protein
MAIKSNTVNLVLSGGGIKGIAFAGAIYTAEKRGYSFSNIAGVSAGALVGAYISAGYTASDLKNILDKFEFEKIAISDIPKKVPVVEKYMKFYKEFRFYGEKSVQYFLNGQYINDRQGIIDSNAEFLGSRGNLLKNVVIFSKEGCLCDGDYLEEWVSKTLAKKGIRTFADLKGGVADKVNPEGYKVRMTAVDSNRGKILVLPDDIEFYGIKPDALEVAKAVRMSTSVPFAFKPVELKKKDGEKLKTYHIIDGGVLDNFPFWLIDSSNVISTLGLKLDEGVNNRLISIDTPLQVIKGLMSAVHDLGIPKNVYITNNIVKIDTSKVSFLDFNLSNDDKEYLFNSGQKAILDFFANMESRRLRSRRNRFGLFNPWFRR